MSDAPCPSEARIVAFMARELAEPERAAIERHLAECDGCRETVSLLVRAFYEPETSTARDAPRLEMRGRGSLVGRYVVLDVVGQGAMGTVYRAYDPELDRQIALKLVRGDAVMRAASRGRLLREARAMAAISHPHVITVHDVGTFEDEVFIAMELVEGVNLSRWLRHRPRDRDEIVEVMCAAGRGLAAAHDAGLVHRDFKPDNVLVGDDGRVRVTDFGLVRWTEDNASGTDAEPQDVGAWRKSMHDQTAAHALVGTPAYMAPEQLDGGVADARSDQFAFCVALFEALAGRRPFAGASLVEIAASIAEGKPDEGTLVLPRSARRAVLRGLSAEPSARHDGMHALVAELQPRRRLLAIVTAALALALLLLIGRELVHMIAGDDQCEAAAAAADRAWDPTRAVAVRAAFMTTGRPEAETAARRVDDAFSAYADDWRRAITEQCGRQQVGLELPGPAALRSACLHRRLAELEAHADLLEDADARTVDNAPTIAAKLVPLSECDDVERLALTVPSAKDGVDSDALRAIEDLLARATAEQVAGRPADAERTAAAAVESARALDSRTLEAEALALRGAALLDAGRSEEATATLDDAIATAIAARHARVLARALIDAMYAVGHDGRDYARGEELGRLAAAAIEAEGGSAEHEAARLNNLASIASARDRWDTALGYLEEALALQVSADDPARATTLHNIASIETKRNNFERARTLFAELIELRSAKLGELHPKVARSRSMLAVLLRRMHRYEDALVELDRAQAIFEATLGNGHPEMWGVWQSRGNVLEDLERFDEALVALREALAVSNAVYGFTSLESASTWGLIAAVLLGQARSVEASSAIMTAMNIEALHDDVDEARLLSTALVHATILCGGDRPAAAVPNLSRLVERFEAVDDSVGPELTASTHWVLGRCLALAGRRRDAIRELERARGLLAELDQSPAQRADAAYGLAEALTGDGRATTRACELVHEAVALRTSVGLTGDDVTPVRAWLANHPECAAASVGDSGMSLR